MKLLFDENLSPRLVELLADVFAGSQHVGQLGLARANDDSIWNCERLRLRHRDEGFRLSGAQPALGLSTPNRLDSAWQLLHPAIESLLRRHAVRIAALESDVRTRFLVLL